MDCPNRCSVQSWKLDEVVGIIPEVYDVWDNARVTSADVALAEPDLNHIYEGKESELLHASNTWGWYMTPDQQWRFDDTQPRSAFVEMAQLRARRNERNYQRKELEISVQGMQQYQADTLPLN
jgi:hypothetical protein